MVGSLICTKAQALTSTRPTPNFTRTPHLAVRWRRAYSTYTPTPPTMRADKRHNNNFNNLKSSLRKSGKAKKKNRVVFDESANEFFEADYIIVVRDECAYSDEECSACEPLSPPEGYKDGGLFNKDGTLKETAWYSGGVALLVGERSGTVFTPHHLQLLRKLQKERMMRNVCADCHEHHHSEGDYLYDSEYEYAEAEVRAAMVAARSDPARGKHIAAGEEQPQSAAMTTTPTEDYGPEHSTHHRATTTRTGVQHKEHQIASFITSEESDNADTEGESSRYSSEESPGCARRRKSGILKGGKLWKSSLENGDKQDISEQSDDQKSTSGEEGSHRSVRFSEDEQAIVAQDIEGDHHASLDLPLEAPPPPLRMDPLTNNIHDSKSSSAVKQLFNSSRPPPPVDPYLITTEALRAWESDKRTPRSEELAIKRVAERNALRCSLLRSETKKKTQNKVETTSLAERIRQLTCDVDEEQDKKTAEHLDSNLELEKKCGRVEKKQVFGPDVADHAEGNKQTRQETKRHILGTLTACVGSTGGHDPFYYQLANHANNTKVDGLTNNHDGCVSDAPAPDVVAGTPGPTDNDDGLSAFAKASTARTDRLKQRYVQDNDTDSDEHDDYGFNRRPTVCGIKSQSKNEMLQTQIPGKVQMANQSTHVPCSNYSSWPYYSESNLSQTSQNSCLVRGANNAAFWPNNTDAQVSRSCSVNSGHSSQSESCYARSYSHAQYARPHDEIYQNYDLYSTIRCTDSKQDMYGSEHNSPIGRHNRRAESPPPIRNYHQTLLYIPYGQIPQHYHFPAYVAHQYSNEEYGAHMQYYQNSSSGTSTPQQQQPTAAPNHTTPLHVQVGNHVTGHVCHGAVSARYRTSGVQSAGQHMICYSEKVAPPLYQPAGSHASPAAVSEGTRGTPEGAPAATSAPTMAPNNNSLYYAMNV